MSSPNVDPITTIDSPLLIIAGSGAGKTHTLVERTLHLVQSGVESENVMVATFTEKAAKELITRVSNRLIDLNYKVNLNEMYIGTLHSIFLRILEENREYTRFKRSYRVLDDFDQKYFVYRYINEFDAIPNSELLLGSHTTGKWKKAQKVIGYVSKISEECLNADELIESDVDKIRLMRHFQKLYQLKLSEENCLDFSNIQSEVLYLLESQPRILEQLQDKIQYIMVDEFQYTSTIQERIGVVPFSETQPSGRIGL